MLPAKVRVWCKWKVCEILIPIRGRGSTARQAGRGSSGRRGARLTSMGRRRGGESEGADDGACEVVYRDPGPLGITFGVAGSGAVWVEGIEAGGTTERLVDALKREIRGHTVSRVNGAAAGSFEEVADEIRRGGRPLRITFCPPSKKDRKAIKRVEKGWVAEGKGERRAAAKAAKEEANATGEKRGRRVPWRRFRRTNPGRFACASALPEPFGPCNGASLF